MSKNKNIYNSDCKNEECMQRVHRKVKAMRMILDWLRDPHYDHAQHHEGIRTREKVFEDRSRNHKSANRLHKHKIKGEA